MDDSQIQNLIEQSVNVILSNQQKSGAYPASPNFKNYQYCWFRDGSFIADAMSRAGQVESAEKFFEWCAKIINDRREQVLNGAKLEARYTYDGKETTDEWETFQLDGFGLWLWAMKQHQVRHNRSLDNYQEAAGLVQHYLVTHWDEPSYDWWEESIGTHAASLSCVYAGLKAYDHPEAQALKQVINASNERVDASLLITGILGEVEENSFASVLERIEADLKCSTGGVHRYKDDVFFGGGEWPVLSGLLGWYYAITGRDVAAHIQLAWINSQLDSNGWLPEQSQNHLLHPEHYQEWVDKWGKPARPLLWSHAMAITLAKSL